MVAALCLAPSRRAKRAVILILLLYILFVYIPGLKVAFWRTSAVDDPDTGNSEKSAKRSSDNLNILANPAVPRIEQAPVVEVGPPAVAVKRPVPAVVVEGAVPAVAAEGAAPAMVAEGAAPAVVAEAPAPAVAVKRPASVIQRPAVFDWSWLCRGNDCTTQLCGDHFVAVAKAFAVMRDVVVDRTRGSGRRGGEQIADVLNQDEGAEYWSLDNGFFDLGTSCDANDLVNNRYAFNKKSHLNKWLSAVTSGKQRTDGKAVSVVFNLTIAVMRYEYVNLYHTMTDYYNAYLVARYYGRRPEDTLILLVDGHPAGSLDDAWKTLFRGYVRIGDLAELTHYEELVWGWLGYDSPLMAHQSPTAPPFLEEFREHFLAQHGVPRDGALAVSCSRPRILFVWRRDYVAHPRNPEGTVSRKVKNEDELLQTAHELYPGAVVSGRQLDLLPLGEQLALIAATDVLVGMHGAGLTLALLLPPGSGLVELYPTYWSASNEHFKAIARWRSLAYAQWQNRDSHLEDRQKRSYIPPATLAELLRKVVSEMCPL